MRPYLTIDLQPQHPILQKHIFKYISYESYEDVPRKRRCLREVFAKRRPRLAAGTSAGLDGDLIGGRFLGTQQDSKAKDVLKKLQTLMEIGPIYIAFWGVFTLQTDFEIFHLMLVFDCGFHVYSNPGKRRRLLSTRLIPSHCEDFLFGAGHLSSHSRSPVGGRHEPRLGLPCSLVGEGA